MADLYKIEQLDGGRFRAFERDDGRWERDRPGRNESFKLSRDGRTFTVTERDDGITAADTYTDRNRDGIFEFQRTDVVSRQGKGGEESYRVDRLTGGRLNVFERDDGRWQLERPDRDERFRLSNDGTTFWRIEIEKRGIEINIYKDFNDDGVYDFVRTRFQESGAGQGSRKNAFEARENDLILSADSLL